MLSKSYLHLSTISYSYAQLKRLFHIGFTFLHLWKPHNSCILQIFLVKKHLVSHQYRPLHVDTIITTQFLPSMVTISCKLVHIVFTTVLYPISMNFFINTFSIGNVYITFPHTLPDLTSRAFKILA